MQTIKIVDLLSPAEFFVIIYRSSSHLEAIICQSAPSWFQWDYLNEHYSVSLQSTEVQMAVEIEIQCSCRNLYREKCRFKKNMSALLYMSLHRIESKTK